MKLIEIAVTEVDFIEYFVKILERNRLFSIKSLKHDTTGILENLEY